MIPTGNGLRCPFCREKTAVIDSRSHSEGIRRRFTTLEIDIESFSVHKSRTRSLERFLAVLAEMQSEPERGAP